MFNNLLRSGLAEGEGIAAVGCRVLRQIQYHFFLWLSLSYLSSLASLFSSAGFVACLFDQSNATAMPAVAYIMYTDSLHLLQMEVLSAANQQSVLFKATQKETLCNTMGEVLGLKESAASICDPDIVSPEEPSNKRPRRGLPHDLDLSNSALTELSRDRFVNYTKLAYLDISNNELHEVPQGLFDP